MYLLADRCDRCNVRNTRDVEDRNGYRETRLIAALQTPRRLGITRLINFTTGCVALEYPENDNWWALRICFISPDTQVHPFKSEEDPRSTVSKLRESCNLVQLFNKVNITIFSETEIIHNTTDSIDSYILSYVLTLSERMPPYSRQKKKKKNSRLLLEL